jgi:hypothetical protein
VVGRIVVLILVVNCFDCVSASSGAHTFMDGRPLLCNSGGTSTFPLKRVGGTVELWRIVVGGAMRAATHCSVGRRRRTRAFRPESSGTELYNGHRQCQSPSATSRGVVEDMCSCEPAQISTRHFRDAPSFWSIQLHTKEPTTITSVGS